MFQKKQYIFSEDMGVCHVDDVTKLALKQGDAILYYVLRSVYQKDKVAYIPVENHVVELRELISLEEATQKAESEEWKQEVLQQSQEEQEIGSTSWLLQLQMADTLPKEERDRIYLRGEIEFVLRQKK